jgi:hypothetical protein
MTTPIVTQMPLQTEPATADSFLDVGADRASPVMRELDHRRSDGIDVRLLWNQTDDRVAVAVFDSKTGEAFEIEAERHEALDAFHHPYSYAAFNRGTTITSSPARRVHLKH